MNKPHKWLAYHTLAVWIGGPLLTIIAVSLPASDPTPLWMWIIFAPVLIATLATALPALVAYYADAKDTETSFSPLWPLWTIAHMTIGSPFVAPLYLARRRLALGKNDYSGTLLGKIGSRARSQR